MAWFRVDDKLHSHNKIRKVLADDPAALALWVVAGSWSSDNGTDGFVPDHQLPWLIPAGADELARKLVSARLWRRVRGGHQIHDFTDWNPTAEKVRAKSEVRAEAGRKGGLNSAKARQDARANAEAFASAKSKQKRTPTQPIPSTSPNGEVRGDVDLICRHLADRIERNGSKRPTITEEWRTDARLLIDKDGRTVEQVTKCIDWCQDSTFWRKNILSMPKLREKFDQLRLAAIDERSKRPANRLTGADSRTGEVDWDDPKTLEM